MKSPHEKALVGMEIKRRSIKGTKNLEHRRNVKTVEVLKKAN